MQARAAVSWMAEWRGGRGGKGCARRERGSEGRRDRDREK